jgi:threonine synthase
MGKVKALVCPKCQHQVPPAERSFFCAACRMILDVQVDLSHFSADFQEKVLRRQDPTIWKWHEFLPVEDLACVVSLGEGYTPLVQTEALARETGLDRLYVRNDTVLPTGSLKDRSNAVGISKAKEFGVTTAAVVSTGNAAASVAAYAAVAGMQAVVIISSSTSPQKVAQAAIYGARIIPVEGPYDQVASIYRAALEEFGWYDCLSSNPYRLEGKKSYAFETWEQLEGEVPNWMIHCIAGGAGVVAAYKGFRELKGLGWIERLPRMVVAQADACAPVVRAFEAGADEVAPVEAGETIAESIRVGRPSPMATRALWDVRASGGAAVGVTDDEIRSAQSLLARTAGIFGEPGGVVSVAAAIRLRQAGKIQPDDLVVCTVSGHGLKQVEVLEPGRFVSQPIPPRLDALRARLEELTRGNKPPRRPQESLRC